jgi:hypothetical protein
MNNFFDLEDCGLVLGFVFFFFIDSISKYIKVENHIAMKIMNMKYFPIALCFAGILLFSGCQNNSRTESQINKKVDDETVSKPPKIYGIEGEDIIIRKGPGEKYEKLINEKATKALKTTQYTQVDYSVKVIILETESTWSKIKVVDPESLSDTHIGWIPTKFIIKDTSDREVKIENLDSNDYEIIKTTHNSSVQNFHLLIKQKKFDKESVFLFVKSFRQEHCTMDCNVNVYDSKSILPLVGKYPLEGKEYISMADHFVSMSTFDAVNIKSWYPFQDFKYKEYGGKNWKKEPVK